MDLARLLRHLTRPDWLLLRAFPPGTLATIERAIAASEVRHYAELRFAVEGGLALGALLRGLSARERALEVFGELRVWDTEYNSGVLIYVQLADRCVELVADRGVARCVPQATWDEICRALDDAYREGHYETGSVTAIERIGALLAQHFPPRGANPNELPDRPVLL